MQKQVFHRENIGWFSDQHLRLVYQQKSFEHYLTEPFSKEALLRQVQRKGGSFGTAERQTLVECLYRQYQDIEITSATNANIDALNNKSTFTITTGHQLSLFTGPLYFVLKILHVIKMCDELNAKHSDYTFVPVYWMASEDHDFEEIQSCTIFNNKITWNTDQKGPVGLFDLEGLDAVKEDLHGLFKNNPDSEIHRLIDSLSGKNYASAMRNLVNAMFGDRGLVIVDGDDKELKSSFVPVFRKELETEFSHKAVKKVTQSLLDDGGKEQVTAREINLFYNEKGLRSRIQRKGAELFVEGKGAFDAASLLRYPEKISPNVVLRPLYQEYILPNIAYIGGGGEISYWLQLKDVFEHAGVPYPLIQVRNSLVWIDRPTQSKLDKLGATVEDIFKDEDAWKRDFVEANASEELDTSQVDQAFGELSEALTTLILGIDSNKDQFIKAELARMEKQVESIKEKAVKFSKGQHDQAMKAIEFIKSRINPDGGLQERSVNFFQFCTTGEVSPAIQELYQALEPFQGDLIVLIDND
jgi:bacillithiol biosynthesis cysteine-adding enzyme BshC